MPSPVTNDSRPKVTTNNNLRNMRSNSLPVNWLGQSQDPGQDLLRPSYQTHFQNQRIYQANPVTPFNNNNNNNTNNMNCGPIMQHRQNGGRYSYSSNQDFVNYNLNYANFRQQNSNNSQQYQVKNNNQHYQNNNQFHEHGNSGYYNEVFPSSHRCQPRTAGNENGAAGTRSNMAASYNYYNGGCNNQQCNQQCGQEHSNYYNGYPSNKFNGSYPKPNNANNRHDQLQQQQQQIQQQHQHQQQYYIDLDRKQENETVTGIIDENSSFQAPPAMSTQEFEENNIVFKDMSTSLNSFDLENTYFRNHPNFSTS